MIFVTGGLYAGKRAWVHDYLGYAEDQMASELGAATPVLFDVQELSDSTTADDLAGYEVVICNEVGCGLVPIDAADRAHREHVGRLACELAKRATIVVRVYCGIAEVIKGEVPAT